MLTPSVLLQLEWGLWVWLALLAAAGCVSSDREDKPRLPAGPWPRLQEVSQAMSIFGLLTLQADEAPSMGSPAPALALITSQSGKSQGLRTGPQRLPPAR